MRTIYHLPPPLSNSINVYEYSWKLAMHAEFVLCNDDDIIAGVTAFYRNEVLKQIYIPYLHVKPEYRRKSVAFNMIEYLSSQVNDYDTMALEVVKTNVPAYNLYLKQHFKIIEDRGQKYLMLKQLVTTKKAKS